MVSGSEALERLRAGNQRYVAGYTIGPRVDHTRRHEVMTGQHPFAVILGCADSRVPAEIVFDQGLGDLFVIRVAGNIVTPVLVGSVEYAVENLGVRLVVVLGHSMCGAIGATLAYMDDPVKITSPNLRAIVDEIRPAVEPLFETEVHVDPAALVAQAVRANVRASTAYLQQRSEVLAHLIATDGLHVIGAEYSLATGLVDFLD